MKNYPWDNLPLEGPMLRPGQAAAYIGLSLSSYYVLVKAGHVPPLFKIGGRASVTPRSWLDAFIASLAK